MGQLVRFLEQIILKPQNYYSKATKTKCRFSFEASLELLFINFSPLYLAVDGNGLSLIFFRLHCTTI